MLAARSGASYSAKAARKDAAPSPDRLLTDRGSYIAYLESQLERVSAACLTVTSFDERLEQAVSAIRCLEEKTLNLARLVAVTQQFAEQQEAAQRESAAEILRRLRGVEARLQELEEPTRAAAWEATLRAVSAQVDAKLAEVGANSEAGLAEAAGRLQAALEEGCHTAHLALEKRMGEAAGRLTEVERKVRAVDERAAKADVTEAAVADLAGRVGGMEDSLAHLAQSDVGMKGSLGSLQTAVAQLKTAVVALELRPPLGDATASSADCLQWLERAREALKREVTDIQQQHVQLAAGLNSAVAAAAAAPASPQKQLAAQVLSGLQCSMQQEVGKELQALRLADQLLESVTSQFKHSPPRGASGGTQGRAASHAAGQPAGGKDAVAVAAGAASSTDAGWTIAAVPAAGAAAGAAGAPQLPTAQASYPPAPTSQQAVAVAADGALAQLQQLAGGEQQLAQAAAALATTAGSPTGTGSSSLRNTFGQMQSMLQSVCQLLQDGGQAPPRRPNEAAYQAAAARYLSRSNTLAQSRRSGSPDGSGTLRRPWMPGGGGKLGSSGGAGAATAASAPAAASRTLSFGGAGGSSGAGAKEALRESVLGQAALEQRRKRLQQLYAELKGQ